MIVVTGASKGLGFAVCNRLISRGFDVFGVARNVDGLEFPSKACDVSSADDVKKLAKELKNGRFDVMGLVNAAGIASMNLAITTPTDIVEKIIRVNLLGTIYCCQSLAPLMMRSRRGVIINFSTIAVYLALKGESAYIASKAGIEGFTRSFAREVSDFNIRVNCIAPGPIRTDLLKGISEIQIESIIRQQVISKQFDKNAVADLVELLFDDRSNSLSGQVLHVGGV